MLGYTFFLWSLATLNLYVSQSLALLPSGVIFPLYIYPGTGCTGWTSVTSAIQNNNILQFYIVVNPNSGPGGAPGSQPDTNYQACIAALRTAGSASQNVKVLGYVATGFGARSSIDVDNDIDTYSRWTSSYRPDGIFFDEGATSANLLPNYQAFAARVHQDFGTSFVVLNPGTTPASSGYFNIADIVVTFEGFYNDFRRAMSNPGSFPALIDMNAHSSSSLVIGTSTPSRKQGVILHDGPTQAPFQIVDELASILNVGVSFITNFPNAVAYENIPTGWTTFLGNLITAQTA